MTSEPRQSAPGFFTLLRRLARTGVGAVQNRVELFAVEWQQEKARLASLLLLTVVLLFCAMMGVALLTGMILLFMPAEWRPWAAGAFAVIYLGAAFAVWSTLKKSIDRESFPESIDQLKRDGLWVHSLDKRN